MADIFKNFVFNHSDKLWFIMPNTEKKKSGNFKLNPGR